MALDNWTVSSNAEWCKLQKQEGKVTVSADQNEGYKQRIAEVTIAYGHQSYSISVKQFGLEPVIDIPGLTDDGMKAVDAKATSLSIQVNYQSEFWMSSLYRIPVTGYALTNRKS